MTRVIYWNINNFSDRKVFRAAPPADALEAQDRFAHILFEVILPAAPDIIVIGEIFDRTREVGFQGVPLQTGFNAGAGVLRILDALRVIDDRWCCVPPLNIGDFGFRESVAVFFNANGLQFTGPYVHCIPLAPNNWAAGRPPTPANIAALQPYARLRWRNALPSAANPTVNLQRNLTWNDGNGAVPEVQSAAQWEFYDATPQRLDWPGAYHRSPYYTRFLELAGAGRTLKLFAIHTSPNTAPAAVNNIPNILELPAAANQASLVIGDFNVDTFGLNVWAYAALDNTHDMLLDPRDPGTLIIDPTRKKYLMTHCLPGTVTNQNTGVVRQVATPFNATGWAGGPDPQHNLYPRYGYQGSLIAGVVSNSGAIDNAFIGYPGGAPAVAHNMTIVNPVVGKPYAPVMGVDPVLTGGLPYASSMVTVIPAGGMNPPPAIAPQVDTINFTHWNNFGRIRSTSDHLALVIDI
jgi:hypothetical protein